MSLLSFAERVTLIVAEFLNSDALERVERARMDCHSAATCLRGECIFVTDVFEDAGEEEEEEEEETVAAVLFFHPLKVGRAKSFLYPNRFATELILRVNICFDMMYIINKSKIRMLSLSLFHRRLFERYYYQRNSMY